jgi:phosphoribosyl 1,2-cyclic phosphodiesterase
MIVRFWGVRGSVPTPGKETLRFGGNTSCVEVRSEKGILIIDGGTGLRPLGERLREEGISRAVLLFSHLHWDHIQGFPFFWPGYQKGNVFEIVGGDGLLESLEEVLRRQMHPPNFPVSLSEMGAEFRFIKAREGQVIELEGFEIKVKRVLHTDVTYAYRISQNGSSLVYATDTEHPGEGNDRGLLRFIRGTDLLIYDAQFTQDEYEGKLDGCPKVGWGHSTPIHGARLAREAKVGKLVLFHHDPSHDDEFIEEMERKAREIFPNTIAAFEGLTVEI